jgi:hypothetical protein
LSVRGAGWLDGIVAVEAFDAVRRRIAAEHAAMTERYEQAAVEYDRALTGLSAFARRPDAPAALRAIQQRVDRGELTWDRVVADGEALEALFAPKGRHGND